MTSGLLAFDLGMIGLVSMRWPEDEDVVSERSHCRNCRRTLSWSNLLPVASCVWTKGRCRTCTALIPAKYPLMELAACGVGVWAALAGSTLPEAVLTALLGWQLLLIAVITFEQGRLWGRLILPLLTTGILLVWVLGR